jgi:Mce-associated membrane protein
MMTAATATELERVAENADDVTTHVTAATRQWLLPSVLAAALIGLLATSAVLWLDQRRGLDEGAVTVARQQAVNFFSLDYRHADHDLDRVLGLATGDFKSEYAAHKGALAESLAAKKIVISATVPGKGTATEYLHGDHAQVLVAVDVTTKQARGPARNNRYRTRVELTRVDGHWLVSGMDQVG